MPIYSLSFRIGVGPGINAGSGPQVPAPAPRKVPAALPKAKPADGSVLTGRISTLPLRTAPVPDNLPVKTAKTVARVTVRLAGRLAEGLSNFLDGYQTRLGRRFQPRPPAAPGELNLGTSPGISSGDGPSRPQPKPLGGAFGGPLFAPGQFP